MAVTASDARARLFQLNECRRMGKPEPLGQNLDGYWSRRITDEHRLVYTVDGEGLIIIQARYHY